MPKFSPKSVFIFKIIIKCINIRIKSKVKRFWKDKAQIFEDFFLRNGETNMFRGPHDPSKTRIFSFENILDAKVTFFF